VTPIAETLSLPKTPYLELSTASITDCAYCMVCSVHIVVCQTVSSVNSMETDVTEKINYLMTMPVIRYRALVSFGNMYS
jgi:hypothetical protein